GQVEPASAAHRYGDATQSGAVAVGQVGPQGPGAQQGHRVATAHRRDHADAVTTQPGDGELAHVLEPGAQRRPPAAGVQAEGAGQPRVQDDDVVRVAADEAAHADAEIDQTTQDRLADPLRARVQRMVCGQPD